MKIKLLSISLLIFLNACQQDNAQKNNIPTTISEIKSTIRLKISPIIPLKAEYKEVTMQTYSYDEGRMMFGVRNIRLGTPTPQADSLPFFITKKGNHLHFNIDNKRHHISNRNIFEYDLPDGKYNLFTFVNRSYGIAIKNDDAILAKRIEVKNKKLKSSKNLEQAALIYNRPHGLYKNEAADKIVLDFLLYNTEIAKNANTVRVTIDQQAVFEIDQYQSYYLEGVGLGEHTCQLELLNASGQRISEPILNKFVVTKEEKGS